MESNEAKIKRVLKTAGVFNWARQNHPRFDDTLAEVRKIAHDPPRRSLAPIDRLCRALADRTITFEDAEERCASYTGYLRMAADEVLPAFHHYLVQNQIETLPELRDKFPYPFGRSDAGKVRTIPVDPTYVGIQGERLFPTFSLGWTKPEFSFHQVRLISTIIHDAILTREDFRGGDAIVLLFPRGKWSNDRDVVRWRVSAYANMRRDELEAQFDRYNRAVAQVIEELKD